MSRILRRGSVSPEVLWPAIGAVVVAALSVFQLSAFQEAGKGPDNACTFSEVGIPGSLCKGLAPVPFADTPEVRKWLTTRQWTEPVEVERRIKGVNDRTKKLSVSAIADADRVPLILLENRALVAARISGDPRSDEDVVYGIGGSSTRDLQKDFYVVVEAFTKPKRLDRLKAIRKVTIAKWTLYGLKQDMSALVPIKSGELKFCRHDHFASSEERKARASFLRCQDAGIELEATHDLIQNPRLQDATHKALREALSTSSLGEILRAVKPGVAMPAVATPAERARRLSLDTLLGRERAIQLYRDQEDAMAFAPAWITCGIGCCSVD